METNLNYIEQLLNKKFIFPPDICTCGHNKFQINKNNRNKNTKFCFRCTKKSCRKIYPLRNNSFYEPFKFLTFYECDQLFQCFMLLEFSAVKTHQYLEETKKLNISLSNIRRFFKEIRRIIYNYYLIQYNVDQFGEENGNRYYSIDESMFVHDVNKAPLWVLGMTENQTKDFRIVVSKTRDEEATKEFITRYIPTGNNIVTDGLSAYDWIDRANSGYTRFEHIHGRNDFGHGIESTSHVESIWGQLKNAIKSTYYIIPNLNFLYYLREEEWKLKVKNLSFQDKLNDFMEMYCLLKNIENDIPEEYYFCNNSELNTIIAHEDDEDDNVAV